MRFDRPTPAAQRQPKWNLPISFADDSDKKKKQATIVFCCIVALFLGSCAFVLVISNPDEVWTPPVKDDAYSSSSSSSSSASDRRQGFHCLSDWDGNHDGMEALIRARLSDPVSMSTIGTRIGSVTGGRHPIALEFTAENAYGGTVRYTARGWVNQGTMYVRR